MDSELQASATPSSNVQTLAQTRVQTRAQTQAQAQANAQSHPDPQTQTHPHSPPPPQTQSNSRPPAPASSKPSSYTPALAASEKSSYADDNISEQSYSYPPRVHRRVKVEAQPGSAGPRSNSFFGLPPTSSESDGDNSSHRHELQLSAHSPSQDREDYVDVPIPLGVPRGCDNVSATLDVNEQAPCTPSMPKSANMDKAQHPVSKTVGTRTSPRKPRQPQEHPQSISTADKTPASTITAASRTRASSVNGSLNQTPSKRTPEGRAARLAMLQKAEEEGIAGAAGRGSNTTTNTAAYMAVPATLDDPPISAAPAVARREFLVVRDAQTIFDVGARAASSLPMFQPKRGNIETAKPVQVLGSDVSDRTTAPGPNTRSALERQKKLPGAYPRLSLDSDVHDGAQDNDISLILAGAPCSLSDDLDTDMDINTMPRLPCSFPDLASLHMDSLQLPRNQETLLKRNSTINEGVSNGSDGVLGVSLRTARYNRTSASARSGLSSVEERVHTENTDVSMRDVQTPSIVRSTKKGNKGKSTGRCDSLNANLAVRETRLTSNNSDGHPDTKKEIEGTAAHILHPPQELNNTISATSIVAGSTLQVRAMMIETLEACLQVAQQNLTHYRDVAGIEARRVAELTNTLAGLKMTDSDGNAADPDEPLRALP